MLIVGEIINTSRRRIAEAVEKQDAAFIGQVAKDQADAGADFIDVNAGTFVDRETEYLCWLVKTVQDAVDLPLCLDSPSPEALSEAVKLHRGEPMINSISLEKDRFDAMLPIVTAQPCRIVALCMTATAMPVTVEDRVQAGAELINRLTAEGVALGNIYIDPLVQPVSVDVHSGIQPSFWISAVSSSTCASSWSTRPWSTVVSPPTMSDFNARSASGTPPIESAVPAF